MFYNNSEPTLTNYFKIKFDGTLVMKTYWIIFKIRLKVEKLTKKPYETWHKRSQFCIFYWSNNWFAWP